jgi:hypothetical protein
MGVVWVITCRGLLNRTSFFIGSSASPALAVALYSSRAMNRWNSRQEIRADDQISTADSA